MVDFPASRPFPMAGMPWLEPTARWVRVEFGGAIIASSTRALLFLQYGSGILPTYYFPPEDVRMDVLIPEPLSENVPAQRFCSVQVEEKTAYRGAWIYQAPPPGLEALRGYITFRWDAMDAWYEEAEQIYAHARDPYKRVDAMVSTRHVRIEVNGETVAESHRPVLLFETSLPTRYYLPADDVRMDLLDPTDLSTRCPYKGVASYYSLKTGDSLEENLVWTYRDPIPENPKIRDLLCFFNEKVDLYVDGVLQDRPISPWSR